MEGMFHLNNQSTIKNVNHYLKLRNYMNAIKQPVLSCQIRPVFSYPLRAPLSLLFSSYSATERMKKNKGSIKSRQKTVDQLPHYLRLPLVGLVPVVLHGAPAEKLILLLSPGSVVSSKKG
jgi:hypothetical protein